MCEDATPNLGFVVPCIFKYSNKTTDQMHNQFIIYCFVAYTPLNMFRALLCPSSRAPSNCLCSHWLPYECRNGRGSSCGRFTTNPKIYTILLTNRPRLEPRPPPHSHGNRRLRLQFERIPDDGHDGARNMLSGVYVTKQ
jgi:hypothetical protein